LTPALAFLSIQGLLGYSPCPPSSSLGTYGRAQGYFASPHFRLFLFQLLKEKCGGQNQKLSLFPSILYIVEGESAYNHSGHCEYKISHLFSPNLSSSLTPSLPALELFPALGELLAKDDLLEVLCTESLIIKLAALAIFSNLQLLSTALPRLFCKLVLVLVKSRKL
jgi:hypothetical protein